MTPQTFGMRLGDEGYGKYTRPHPDLYKVRVSNRMITHYRPAQGYPEWVAILSSDNPGGGTTAHRKVTLTDHTDNEKLYKEACRWVFQGLRP